ncbi:hypothetical protein [Candidatus Symbiobacter mobilis]|uniref:Uncharacterized protein n=1 Tax=Candidatus Symbiobacter mobilis CR TaxID=946483 RepID=U5NEK8_9BURK|nr:hypothetical protein [Candidatus Symbiobacter mobilis]AGX88668.1 hypothetical protein Cenrod_2618 [Candidatus Symbiobacter mobilis CR]
MAALTSTQGASTSLQVSMLRQRLEAARREAAQAQTEVDDLRERATSAENRLQERKETVGYLTRQQSDPTYTPQGSAPRSAEGEADSMMTASAPSAAFSSSTPKASTLSPSETGKLLEGANTLRRTSLSAPGNAMTGRLLDTTA